MGNAKTKKEIMKRLVEKKRDKEGFPLVRKEKEEDKKKKKAKSGEEKLKQK